MIRRAWLTFWLAAISLVVSWTGGLAQPSQHAISYEADSISLDLETGSSVFRGVTVSDGIIRIYAAEGRTTGDMDGRGLWTFERDVYVELGAGTLMAHSATLRISEGQLIEGELLGDPVVFDSGTERAPFHGTARRMSYDGTRRVLSASDGAWFASEGFEVHNCNWTIDLDRRSVVGVPEVDKCVARLPVNRESSD